MSYAYTRAHAKRHAQPHSLASAAATERDAEILPGSVLTARESMATSCAAQNTLFSTTMASNRWKCAVKVDRRRDQQSHDHHHRAC